MSILSKSHLHFIQMTQRLLLPRTLAKLLLIGAVAGSPVTTTRGAASYSKDFTLGAGLSLYPTCLKSG